MIDQDIALKILQISIGDTPSASDSNTRGVIHYRILNNILESEMGSKIEIKTKTKAKKKTKKKTKTKRSIKIEAPSYITYSKNVFIPLTHVCRNSCGYCGFRKEPESHNNILKKKQVVDLLQQAESARCTEALFTFGEHPEVYPAVRRELHSMGYSSIIQYLTDLCEYTVEETSLFPHSNPGVLSEEEILNLKPVNASLGLMLETSSERLMGTRAHELSPGKSPSLRLKTLELAGKHSIPFTTGILVGIGETDQEIYQSLLDIKRISQKYGHIQEIIIQNFQPKKNTSMQDFRPVSLAKLASIVTLARLMIPDMSIQVPPNLNKNALYLLIGAGANDMGGISPVTPDYVNPEHSWPDIDSLSFEMRERLCVYPEYINRKFLSDDIYKKAISITDNNGFVRSSNEHRN